MAAQNYLFHIKGMHCNACILMTESELMDLPHISLAKSSLKTHTVEVTGDFGEKDLNTIAEELTEVLIKHGYSISTEKATPERNWADFKLAVPIAAAFIFLFILLQKLGIVNIADTQNVSYGTAFVVGIIASLSTCMAVVGGLLLSMSATFAKEGDKIKPQLLFHAGRLISFFILGGVIGALGSAFALSTSATFVLSLLVGLVMLILGINLLDIFHFAKKLQPAMPKFFSRHTMGLSKLNHRFVPFLVGVLTFFLPCGFTQSMQIYTLTTGTFWAGAMTMFVYSLGTLPVLALISFSSFSIKNSSKSGIFFKTAGLVVIAFALFNLLNSLVIIGVLPPLFNF